MHKWCRREGAGCIPPTTTLPPWLPTPDSRGGQRPKTERAEAEHTDPPGPASTIILTVTQGKSPRAEEVGGGGWGARPDRVKRQRKKATLKREVQPLGSPHPHLQLPGLSWWAPHPPPRGSVRTP